MTTNSTNGAGRRAPVMLAAMMIAIGGCGGAGAPPAIGGGGAAVAVSGIVHGGQNPVAGAKVFVYQAGSSGYGTGNRQLACTTTNAVGQFSFGSTSPSCGITGVSNAFSCPAAGSPDIYLVATGGNPGAGNNPALQMMTVLGNCNALPSAFSVSINELTTVASIWALSRFAQCAFSPGTSCPATAENLGSSATNQTGLGNSMAVAGNLANLATGSALSSAGGVTRPNQRLNTLADIIQDCVNSTGAASAACADLFTCAVPGATPAVGNLAPCKPPAGAVAPVDTLTAALDIARNPANNVITLFNLTSKTPGFTPTLAAAPNDWTLTFNYASALLGSLQDIAVDAAGNAWVTNRFPAATNTVAELGPLGAFLSSYANGGIVGPLGVAVDAAGSIWVTSDDSDAITEISSAGSFLSGANGFMGGGMLVPEQIAIDSQGNAWVADGANLVIKINSLGTFLSGSNGFRGGGLNQPFGIAIDAKNDAWVTNSNGNSVTEFNSTGALVSPSSGCPGTTNCGYLGGGLNRPFRIAIDPAGNAWIANFAGNSVTEIGPNGVFVSPTSGCPSTTNCGYRGGGIDGPVGIASDATGNVWVANQNGNSLSEISGAGKLLSPAAGFLGAGLNLPVSDAIDSGGDIWMANLQGGSVTEFVGLAAPVLTPNAACLKLNTGHAVCLP